MRILHCILALNTGGSETMLVDLINEQVKRHEVFLIVVNDSYESYLVEQLDKRVHLRFLKRKPGSRNPWFLLKLNGWVLRLQADAIHVHNSSLLKMVVCRTGKGLFFTVHSLDAPLAYAERATCLFAISEAVAVDVRNRCKQPVVVVPNGIVVDKIQSRATRMKGAGDLFRMVAVGRLDAAIKGQDILIRAIGKLRDRGVQRVTVDLIGEGQSREELEKLVADLRLTDRVHFLGLCDRQYIYAHLQDYDLFCHPSRSEGFGLTVAEAMVAKLPVLVASDGGPAELVKQGELGSIFQNGSADDCADKLVWMMEHYQEATAKVDAAYDYVKAMYSLERMAQQYVENYHA